MAEKRIAAESPPVDAPQDAPPPAVTPVFRGISARVAAVILLLIAVATMAAAGVYSVAGFAERAVAEVAEVGRLRMYTKALTLEAVRPGVDAEERVRRFDEVSHEVEGVFARLADGVGTGASLDGRSLPLRIALDNLRDGWRDFRARGVRIASGRSPDPTFYVAEREMLNRAESLVDAVIFQAARTRDHYLMLIALGLGVGVGLSGFIFNLIRRRLIGPALELNAASRRLAGGDFAARIEVRGDDEIGMLGRAFNASAARLAAVDSGQRAHAAAVSDAEQRDRSLWETAADGIVIIDADNMICFANPSIGRLLGYAPEHMAGHPLAMIQPEDRRDAHRRGFARYLASGGQRENRGAVATRVLHADGHEVEVELSFSRFETAEGSRFAAFFRESPNAAAPNSGCASGQRATR